MVVKESLVEGFALSRWLLPCEWEDRNHGVPREAAGQKITSDWGAHGVWKRLALGRKTWQTKSELQCNNLKSKWHSNVVFLQNLFLQYSAYLVIFVAAHLIFFFFLWIEVLIIFLKMPRPLCSPVGMNFWFQLTKFVLLKLISPIFVLAGTRIVTSGLLFAEARKQLGTDVSCCSSHPLFRHIATLLHDSVGCFTPCHDSNHRVMCEILMLQDYQLLFGNWQRDS